MNLPKDFPNILNLLHPPRNTLDEYLELHTLVEHVQTIETLPDFIYRLIRDEFILLYQSARELGRGQRNFNC